MTKKLLILLLVCLTLPAFAQPWAPKQVLVQLQPKSTIESFIAGFNRSSGMYVTGVEKVSASWNIWLVKTTGDEQLALTRVFDQPSVQQAQLNHYLKERSVVPDDTLFFMQWNLQNTGQSGGVPGADLQMTDAWGYNTGGVTALGDTIVVAVVDGGTDLTHPDIDYWKNYAEVPGDSIDNDANGYTDDYDGWNAHNMNGIIPSYYHGTHIAGIIGAKGGNLQGVAGVNWHVKIMPVVATSYTDAEVMRSYSYVFDMRKAYNASGGASGAFVVATNSSFGVDFANPANYPMWCALYDSMGRQGILSSGATSNSNVDVDASYDMPTSCSSDYLITVTSTTRNDTKSSSCGYGATTVDWVHRAQAYSQPYPAVMAPAAAPAWHRRI